MFQAKNITLFLQTLLVLPVIILYSGLSVAEADKTEVPDYALGTGDTVRIQVYNEETTPLLGFYRERGVLVDIPGDDTIEGVNNQVMTALGAKPWVGAG